MGRSRTRRPHHGFFLFQVPFAKLILPLEIEKSCLLSLTNWMPIHFKPTHVQRSLLCSLLVFMTYPATCPHGLHANHIHIQICSTVEATYFLESKKYVYNRGRHLFLLTIIWFIGHKFFFSNQKILSLIQKSSYHKAKEHHGTLNTF